MSFLLSIGEGGLTTLVSMVANLTFTLQSVRSSEVLRLSTVFRLCEDRKQITTGGTATSEAAAGDGKTSCRISKRYAHRYSVSKGPPETHVGHPQLWYADNTSS